MNNLVQKSIIKKYRKEIWSKYIKTIKQYNLIEDGDKIAVCISGGKDSFLLALLLKQLQKYGTTKFEVSYICMDPGYDTETFKTVNKIAEKLDITLDVFKTDVFESAKKLSEKSPCYMCARMRRGHLYNYAKNKGCNKIALGHHLDDVIETTLMSMFYNGEFKTMRPIVKSKNFHKMELIRPMYHILEEDIVRWANYNNLNFINCACGLEENLSKRFYIKDLIKALRKDNKFFDANILKSLENIDLEQTLFLYKKNQD